MKYFIKQFSKGFQESLPTPKPLGEIIGTSIMILITVSAVSASILFLFWLATGGICK